MGGPDVSAGLPVSPQGPDHIFISPRNGEMVGVWSQRILKTSSASHYSFRRFWRRKVADEALLAQESFLLIFRISHIVTAVKTTYSLNDE